LTDEELSFALDGLADKAIDRHLAQCPACAARFENMQRLETFLTKHLGRSKCPSPQHLADYRLGLLEAAAAETIRQHVAKCPRCQEEVDMLTQFQDVPMALNELQSEAEDAERPTNIIMFPTPSYLIRAAHVQISGSLALKGAEDESAHDAKAGTASIFLESKVTPGGFMLTGQILDNQVNWVGAVASIHQTDSPEQVCILDNMSEFSFELKSDAPLDLYITASSGVTLRVENITIRT
jgi:hypothetical protein